MNNLIELPSIPRRHAALLHRRPSPPQGLVRDRMSFPAISVGPTARVSRIWRILETRKISAVPVVDKRGTLVGIVSTTDILRATTTTTAVEVLRAKDIMVAPVVVAHPDERLDEAAWRMTAARAHRLVVIGRGVNEAVSGGGLRGASSAVLGVISVRDMLEELMTRRLSNPISDVMTREVATIAIGDPTNEAIDRLLTTNVHGLIVVDGTLPIGVFTHQEALAARRLPPALRSVPVEELMSYETICLDRSTPIWRAAGHAMATNVRRLLICENKHLVGVASLIDLAGALAQTKAVAKDHGGKEES